MSSHTSEQSLSMYENRELEVRDLAEKVDHVLTDVVPSSDDPGLLPFAQQIKNHLVHVGYNFRIARDSEDYPYELHDVEAFQPWPTHRATARADRFLQLLSDNEPNALQTTFTEAYGEQAKQAQEVVVKALLEDPIRVQADFMQRRQTEGDEASFPELGHTLKSLQYEIATKSSVEAACAVSPIIKKLRDQLLYEIEEKVNEATFGYTSTLMMIEDAVAFFDVVTRTIEPDSPEAYHSARFEYNWHRLAYNDGHTLLPTMVSVNPVDLLKIRGVSVGIIGVSTETIQVDGFKQTPYEFFHHDVDHTRRMHEETLVAIEREGISAEQFSEQATALIHEELLKAIDIEDITDSEERDVRIAMRMILFEILHEDAYDPTKDTIADAILRPPMERTPFERLTEGKTVEYFTAPRASTLAHVFRKLAHTFYDVPEQRSTNLGSDFTRTRLAITQGAANLYRLVSDDPIDDEALLTTCRDLVSTDEGFTDAFIGNIARDISSRGVGRSALKLMISKPMGVHQAVRNIRRDGQTIHTLFGYSALEYEDPELLEQTIVADLSQFDPDETAIAIGATPYGIGRTYPLIKELGFTTLGIVASTAVGKNEESAEGVDRIVVVKDTGWGGYRYAQNAGGLLSPTTRAFVGASDSIAAYGGGDITAVTIEEMVRREKPVTFTPFDMNHRIADMLQAQRGEHGSINYAGPADEKWQQVSNLK